MLDIPESAFARALATAPDQSRILCSLQKNAPSDAASFLCHVSLWWIGSLLSSYRVRLAEGAA